MTRFSYLLAVGLWAAILAGCGGKGPEAGHGERSPAVVVKGVQVETVKAVAVPDLMEVVGTVKARTSAVVSARIPGTVTVLKVREGDRVRKGQLLARLDAQETGATGAAAVAGSDEAQRALDEAQARKRLADVTFDRYQRLYKEQAVTRQEFDTKQTEQEVAAQGVARAQARYRQAREGARAASRMADYATIVAPISGVVTARQVDLGSTVFPAQPLMTIDSEGSYQLELALPESLATRAKVQTPLQVTLDALQVTISARIAEIVPSADPQSRTFIAKVPLDRKGVASGMFGRASISLGSTANGILLPERAVVERGALTSVWVVDQAHTARMRLVKSGKSVGGKVEILSGLSDGERVVVSGADKVSEGAKVE
ncbi:efflux RND transporter periplasmic adaptor subunit [Oryzomonas sagensis]|uniref:Efflux RND transporter periplasmic adaptor subunit n=1 Tax=Oryzomonas sagensis TaxID=2603857 RepID=A0ABQ6TS50_9BACT|nr:efflux RND transporter periplasmic adaptor subunit [Oryzomonas sagensis]KAB0671797.1 efflux RND transporter periplasmic adaptor subunit [Oryzomonas sagensis]